MKKNNSKSWLILGVTFLVILFVVSYLMEADSLYLSYGAESLISVVFGFGGVLFLLIGIVKSVISKFRK